MQSKEEELATEINRCNGCIKKKEQTDKDCQQWIRISSKINVISDALIKKGSNKIKIAIDQITEKIKEDRAESKEQKLKELIMIEELEVELIKWQKIKEIIS